MRNMILFICVLVAGCNDSGTSANIEDTKITTSDTSNISTEVDAMSCYAYRSAADTVLLTLTTTGSTVSGDLIYAYSEKDKNTGTISGVMRGDTLLADYTFMSEGKSSVRQVAFLKQNDGFVEGYGNSKMEDGKMVFENLSALKFSNTMALKKEPCGPLN